MKVLQKKRLIYFPESIEEARAKAKELKLLLTTCYDGYADMDYLEVMSMKEYQEADAWYKASIYRGWIRISEDYREEK